LSREEENDSEEKQEKTEKPVILTADAYKTIILYASRFANKAINPSEWKEIYGILIGHTNNDFVFVERAEALTYGHATDVQLDEKHYIFIDQIQQKLDEENKGNFIVGWFHSHPGLNLFFSYIDLINQLGFQQSNPDFIGLVFDHELLGKKKQEIVEGTNHKITKYDTGFEIYRLTDVEMDINNPKFDNNYHKVDYIINGLNKFFFANILSELSALVTKGKPLQSAYGEVEERNENNMASFPLENELEEIPVDEDFVFDVDDFFYGTANKKEKKTLELKKQAEEYIYEGNIAFNQKNPFMGVEKYRKGIKIYKDLKEISRVLELLRNVSEFCIMSEHLVLAKEFAEDLFKLATKNNSLFYLAESQFLMGSIDLKEAHENEIETALKLIQEASIIYEKAADYAGAGKSYQKIGSIYHSRLSLPFNTCLFYVEAIRSFNQALIEGNPLRKDLWNKPDVLSKEIIELKNIVDSLISKIKNQEEREKILNDLNSLQFNF
jgi:proteasome lid subunit RPN8/RPN11/tetratricopeptide (TPR) repeat protein